MTEQNAQYFFSSSDEAEEAFYFAFEERDLIIMKALLAEKNVTCIHPDSFPLVGRDKVLECWQQIFNDGFDNVFKIKVLSKSVLNDIAVHVVSEEVFERHNLKNRVNHVIATNVYIHEKNGWRQMTHHGSFFREEELNLDTINSVESSSNELDELVDQAVKPSGS